MLCLGWAIQRVKTQKEAAEQAAQHPPRCGHATTRYSRSRDPMPPPPTI